MFIDFLCSLEPFRVPIAGKVDCCVFDKTGTLTTDELVAVGIVSESAKLSDLKSAFASAIASLSTSEKNSVLEARSSNGASTAGMAPLKDASVEALLVLGACNSLVLVDGKVAGDPLETASMKGIGWELLEGDICRPKPASLVDRNVVLNVTEGKVEIKQVRILARHHFSSKLQRMSVLGVVPGVEGGFALVKGSPEALLAMCPRVSEEYTQIASDLAKRGMRVIALGYKRLTTSQLRSCIESRSETESELTFCGFVSFTCRVRKDSADIVRQLRGGGCVVAMATGDAILTGIHVAREVGITTETKRSIQILEQSGSGFVWSDYNTEVKTSASFDAHSLQRLASESDLCVSGSVISSALDANSSLREHLHLFCVFARMRPDEKERVLLAMKDHGRTTLMCGDGANDVGALKQAHVGIALLSGFGDLNGSKITEGKVVKATPPVNGASNGAVALPVITESQQAFYDAVNIQESELELSQIPFPDLIKRLRLIGVEPNDYPEANNSKALSALYLEKAALVKEEKKDMLRRIRYAKLTPAEQKIELAREQRETAEKKAKEFQDEYSRLLQKGESWAMVKAMQNIWKSTNEEMKKKREESTFENHAGKMASMMEGFESMEDTELPMIKIGDASVASPFTSKMPSIRSAVDIIRQGRCTLVTTIQMYQILALNCLISAYSLSVLHLDGIKYGDKQMTCLGILSSISFVSISRSKPLEKLSAVTPLKSIFHPALFLSLLGQFSLHLLTMYMLVQECKKIVPLDSRPEFMKEFKPSLLNSVVFLVSAVQNVSVFVVNLKGPPFMGGLVQNSPLLWSLTFTFVGTFFCASEYIPQLNSWLQLEPFPSASFRNMVLTYLFCDVVGAFLWDRLMLGIFAFQILRASLESTTRDDVFNILKKLVWVGLIVRWVATQDYSEVIAEMEKASNATAPNVMMDTLVSNATGAHLGGEF